MPQENQSEIFIRLLGDAVQADRLIRKSIEPQTNNGNEKRTQRLFPPDIDNAMHAIGPLDCIQLMVFGSTNQQHG